MYMKSAADQMMSALAFGPQHSSNQTFFQQQLQRAQNYAGGIGEQFYEKLQVMHDSYYGVRALEIAKAALNQVVGLFQPDVLRELRTMDDFQTAGSIMQRWVMANPVVRERFQQQRCAGYGDGYADAQPGAIGEGHYDYRRVMDGIIVETEDGGWRSVQYIEDVHPEDENMIDFDQFTILRTWARAERFMADLDKDPTSVWNENL